MRDKLCKQAVIAYKFVPPVLLPQVCRLGFNPPFAGIPIALIALPGRTHTAFAGKFEGLSPSLFAGGAGGSSPSSGCLGGGGPPANSPKRNKYRRERSYARDKSDRLRPRLHTYGTRSLHHGSTGRGACFDERNLSRCPSSKCNMRYDIRCPIPDTFGPQQSSLEAGAQHYIL